MHGDPEAPIAIRAAALLADPTRRTLYDIVSTSPRPVARDEAAAAAGVGVSLAAFHLDRLADAGLLAVEYRRRGNRRGPGAGRPAKLYRRADVGIDLTLPARRYALAASLLAEAVAASDGAAFEVLLEAARARGRGLADATTAPTGSSATRAGAPRARAAGAGAQADADPVLDALAALGFEPIEREDRGVINLRNCPYHAIAQTHRAVACPMNLALLEGLAERLGGIIAIPDDTPQQCCVAVRRLAAGASRP
jgi:predicted ArsR family transcriptional regulator